MKYLKKFEGYGDLEDDDLVTIYKNVGEEVRVDPSKQETSKVKFYDLPYKFYNEVSYKLMKEYPEFNIHQRGRGQFYDFDFKFDSKTTIWVGCYDMVYKIFYLFVPEEGNGSVGHYDQRKVVPEICISGEELADGFERFVGLWYDIKDNLSTDKRWPDLQERDGPL